MNKPDLYACEQCKRQMALPPDYWNTPLKCPACGEVFEIPPPVAKFVRRCTHDEAAKLPKPLPYDKAK